MKTRAKSLPTEPKLQIIHVCLSYLISIFHLSPIHAPTVILFCDLLNRFNWNEESSSIIILLLIVKNVWVWQFVCVSQDASESSELSASSFLSSTTIKEKHDECKQVSCTVDTTPSCEPSSLFAFPNSNSHSNGNSNDDNNNHSKGNSSRATTAHATATTTTAATVPTTTRTFDRRARRRQRRPRTTEDRYQ